MVRMLSDVPTLLMRRAFLKYCVDSPVISGMDPQILDLVDATDRCDLPLERISGYTPVIDRSDVVHGDGVPSLSSCVSQTGMIVEIRLVYFNRSRVKRSGRQLKGCVARSLRIKV